VKARAYRLTFSLALIASLVLASGAGKKWS